MGVGKVPIINGLSGGGVNRVKGQRSSMWCRPTPADTMEEGVGSLVELEEGLERGINIPDGTETCMFWKPSGVGMG